MNSSDKSLTTTCASDFESVIITSNNIPGAELDRAGGSTMAAAVVDFSSLIHFSQFKDNFKFARDLATYTKILLNKWLNLKFLII